MLSSMLVVRVPRTSSTSTFNIRLESWMVPIFCCFSTTCSITILVVGVLLVVLPFSYLKASINERTSTLPPVTESEAAPLGQYNILQAVLLSAKVAVDTSRSSVASERGNLSCDRHCSKSSHHSPTTFSYTYYNYHPFTIPDFHSLLWRCDQMPAALMIFTCSRS